MQGPNTGNMMNGPGYAAALNSPFYTQSNIYSVNNSSASRPETACHEFNPPQLSSQPPEIGQFRVHTSHGDPLLDPLLLPEFDSFINFQNHGLIRVIVLRKYEKFSFRSLFHSPAKLNSQRKKFQSLVFFIVVYRSI